MRELHVDIGTFQHLYNNVRSNVIFDTSDVNGWKLVFIKCGEGTVLTIPILKGYLFAIQSNEKYREFIRYFKINGEKGSFHIKEFESNLEKQIPTTYNVSDKERITISTYRNDHDGIYPIGIKNWELIHARDQNIPKGKFHRSSENLNKTKNLYPDI